jgi:hypothetical protein
VTEEELIVCATLRLLPETYLYMKKSLLKAVFTYGPFKNRDAQKWYRMDVNKTSQVYEWFRVLGWIPSSIQEWNELVEEHKRERRAVRASTYSAEQEDHSNQEAVDEDDTGSNNSTTDAASETSSSELL